ncbi:MAG TPA: tyrosine--tRNA ligase [Bryobacteraceae bacterium]|nr:tyrosine--tRNA ligase [Bryobacteraceae bacterium]
MTSFLSDLRARGLLDQASNEEALERLLNQPGASIYIGFDPTADSLHVGSLLPILLLARLQRAGHRPIVLVGGATGMVGDPSGRSTERNLLDFETLAGNVDAVRAQLSRFVSFEGENAARLVDNAEWTAPISYLDWLRNVGKYFTVNYMIAKESVRRRLEDREQGISYTEFSYMLLQAHDFLQLFDAYGCTIQAGGSDQWGNITAGIDLVRKARAGAEVYGFTHPLLATSSGEKFGKSAGNAVWLDARRTSPYQFYQFWVQAEDADVERYLKLFTFESLESISESMAAHGEHPERREAQKLLASRMTEIVHGKEGLEEAVRASEALFGKELSGLSDEELTSIFADVPSKTLERTTLGSGLRLSQALVAAGACASKGEANRLIQGGGVYLNNRRMSADGPVTEADLASKSMLVLRTGKKSYFLVRFV